MGRSVTPLEIRSRDRAVSTPRLRGLLLLVPLLTTPTSAAVQGPTPLRFAGLRPGERVVHSLTVPVRIVLVGFDEDQVDEAELLRSLPRTYKPVARFPKFYGLGRDLGLEYRFRYQVVRKGRRFRDDFFAHLERIAVRGPLTLYQTIYNEQERNVLDVTGPVLHIDGPTVEKWLDDNDADPRQGRGYTLFFLNWFGEDGFRFHVYTKTDEPDPDTRYNFGERRESRKMVAWGGSHGRSWFYDFSAGPEAWAGNYDVENADLDEDGEPDYRIPPIWEYRDGGYRPPRHLSRDMGRLARFVGIDLLFTTSPLYDPLVTAPDPGGTKVAHVAMLQGEDGSSGLRFIDSGYARDRWRRFQPYYRWRTGLSDHPREGAQLAFDIFVGSVVDDQACWVPFGGPFAQLFCHFNRHLSDYIPDYDPRDYVEKIFAFTTNDSRLDGLLGFADEDWATGRPSHVFMFGGADAREAGYGFTATGIHEVGHHLGMSHPHDGYDSEMDLDFDAVGSLFYAWAGDESHTVMHSLALSNGFGKFDQDNLYRWETAGYLNGANSIAAGILARSRKNEVSDLVEAADALARQAADALRAWDYLRGAQSARRAHDLLAEAARTIGAPTRAPAAPLRVAGGKARHQVCRARFVRE